MRLVLASNNAKKLSEMKALLGGHPGVQSAVYAPLPALSGLEREAHRALQDDANNSLLLGLADQGIRQLVQLQKQALGV